MVKYSLIVLAVALSIILAFYCDILKTSRGRGDDARYSAFDTVDDRKCPADHSCPMNRRSLNCGDSELNAVECPDRPSKTPRSNHLAATTAAHRCSTYSDTPEASESVSERSRSTFRFGDCSRQVDDFRCSLSQTDPCNFEADLSRNVPETPRAASSYLAAENSWPQPIDVPPCNSQRGSNQEHSLRDVEKCCNLFFCNRQNIENNGISKSRHNGAMMNIVSPQEQPGSPCKVKDVAAEGELVPPDGGWGWLVLLASVMVNVLIPGTIKSFGVLFIEFLEVFDASPAAALWIPALCYFLYSSLGPLSSVLSVRYSYRTVTLIGGTFAAAGMMLSFFASSVGFLCISYGVFVGIGAGLSFPPTVYITTSYFVRLRGLANGLCISGSALGSIFLPPILRLLLQEYGYRGAVLLMGAVTLNVWAAALLYEPVEKHMKRVPISNEPEDEDEMEAGSIIVTSPEEEKKLNNMLIIPNSKSQAAAPIVPKSASSVALENYKNTPIQGRMRKISVPSGRDLASQMHSTPALHAVPERGGFESGRLSRRRTTARSPSSSSFNYVSTPYHGSTLSALHPEHASTLTLNAINNTFARKAPEKRVEATDAPRAKFFDISLLKDPMYLVILISNSTNAVSYTNFVILLPAYATTLEFDKNMASLLLSTVSILDLIGRIGGSALSDIKIMPKHWYFVGGLVGSGVSLALLPLATSYLWLSVYCGVFGLASGIYVGVTAVIMADMLGTEKLTSSYGISLFVNGVIQLIGPPICGLIFEQIGSYGPIFTILGIILVAGASLWGFMPLIKRRQRLAATAAQIDKL